MISLQSVTKLFGSFVAVDDVSLNVRAGEFLTLLGPSGCGKTTLLRMISGFETPSQGRVLLDGKDVTELPPYQRDVNQVFQSYALFPHLTVWENIAFGLRSRRTPKSEIARRVDDAVAMVGLTGMEPRKPSQLSGGQRQRVALARALVCEPKVLLLDEPLAALDAKLRRAMQLELKKLQQRLGITFVFVTHDQDEAIVMSDRIAVINGGKIEQLAAAAEIYRNPATRFVADFLGQANLIPVTIIERVGNELVLRSRESLILRATRTGSEDGQLLACVRPENIHLHETPAAEAFPATITEVIFRGPITHLVLTCLGDLRLTALTSNPRYSIGQKLFCRIEPTDVVILADSTCLC
jgi:spermidine/putrescine transport system ATP-binding protein